MVQTYNDYLLQCDLYEYSQEYFDILKESTELDLMLEYLTTRDFLAEYAEDLEDEGYTFTEGYFMEANEDASETGTKAAGKVTSLLERIANGISRIFSAIFGFFKKLGSKMENSEKVRKAIEGVTIGSINSDNYMKIRNAIEESWDDSWNAKYSLTADGKDFDVATVFNQIKTGEFTLYLNNNKKINEDAIISIEDFNKLVASANKAIAQAKVNGKIKGALGFNMKEALKKKTLLINVNSKAMDRVENDLERGLATFKELMNDIVQKTGGSKLKTTAKLGAVAGAGAVAANATGRAVVGGIGKFVGKTVAGVAGKSAAKVAELSGGVAKGAGDTANALSKLHTVSGNWLSSAGAGLDPLKNLGEEGGMLQSFVTKLQSLSNSLYGSPTAQYVTFGIIAVAILGGIFMYGRSKHRNNIFASIMGCVNDINRNILRMYQNVYSFRMKTMSKIAALNLQDNN